RRHPIQAKFVVNTPGDKYEREADWFAEHVMRLPDERPGPTRTPEFRATDNDLHAAMTRTEPFEAAAESANMQIGRPVSGGTALDAPLRAFFEPRFGCDFARVRVHADASAAERNRAVRADAFTIGSEIHFAAGKYSPATAAGKKLLAHELTHVVQQ